MSGILGIFHTDNRPVSDEDLNRMAHAMAHRGPDGMHTWHNGPAGLGHCMLCATPEAEGERLPYIDTEAGLVITADARIDNRVDLAALLGLLERLRDNITDSQLILAAYRKWGRQCVKYLLGDFAFVIWDWRQQRLFCARDHLGVKPFYYHHSSTCFVFASEVRALLQVPDVPHRINEARIADYLVQQLEGIDKTSTFHEEIFRLPPAHTLSVNTQGKLLDSYWEPDPEKELRLSSDEEYVEAFQDLLVDAVGDRLRCSGRPAGMLSGGVDSSAVVGVANKLLQEAGMGPLQVYSGVADDESDCIESRNIRAMIAHCGLDAIALTPNQLPEYNEALQSVFTGTGDLFDAGMVMPFVLYLMAHTNSSRVMLDGVEGDMVHSLSPSWPAYLLRNGHWIRAFSEINGQRQHYYNNQLPWWKVCLMAVRTAVVTQGMRRWRSEAFSASLLEKTLEDSIINRDFADRIDIQGRLAQLYAQGCNGLCATPREQHIRTLMHPYLAVGLERYDRVAGMCSVEPRHPLLDKRLVEFNVSLPWDQLVRHGWSKYALRRSMGKFVPDEIVWSNEKQHLGWSFTRLLVQRQHDAILEVINKQKDVLEPYVEHAFLDKLMTGNVSIEKPETAQQLWLVYNLSHWLHQKNT